MRRRHAEAGFSLLESLAALTIIAAALGLCLSALGEGLQRADRAAFVSQALPIARLEIESAAHGPLALGEEVREMGAMRLVRSVAPARLSSGAAPPIEALPDMWHLRVTVSQGRRGQVRLETLVPARTPDG